MTMLEVLAIVQSLLAIGSKAKEVFEAWRNSISGVPTTEDWERLETLIENSPPDSYDP